MSARASKCVCVCAACVRVCVRACVCACVCVHVHYLFITPEFIACSSEKIGEFEREQAQCHQLEAE